MPLIENKGNYLLIEADEPYSLKLLLSMIHQLHARCLKDGLDKVLVDLTRMDGSASIIDRYDIGVELAKVLGSRIKVAAALHPGLINLMTETVAVNRGARLKVFGDIERAMEWLNIE